MKAREFNKQIELYQTVTGLSDGFGGYNQTDELIGVYWANIKNVKPQINSIDFGNIEPNEVLQITMRNRLDLTFNSINQFIKYRNNKYIIITDPININFEDRIIQFLVKKVSNTIENDMIK